jgi:hypothetical protein
MQIRVWSIICSQFRCFFSNFFFAFDFLRVEEGRCSKQAIVKCSLTIFVWKPAFLCTTSRLISRCQCGSRLHLVPRVLSLHGPWKRVWLKQRFWELEQHNGFVPDVACGKSESLLKSCCREACLLLFFRVFCLRLNQWVFSGMPKLQPWTKLLRQFYQCFNCAGYYDVIKLHHKSPLFPNPIQCCFGLKTSGYNSCVIKTTLQERSGEDNQHSILELSKYNRKMKVFFQFVWTSVVRLNQWNS